MPEPDHPAPSLALVSLRGKCPRCGEGALYRTFLGFQPRCSVCGLDHAAADAGDGPAVFVIFVTGFVSVTVAFMLRYQADLSAGVTVLLGCLLTVVLSALLLRPAKSLLYALQWRHDAHEGRVE